LYFGQPAVNLREFLPDEANPSIKMGESRGTERRQVAPEFKHLGSILSKNFYSSTSKNFDDIVTLARTRSCDKSIITRSAFYGRIWILTSELRRPVW
jgi:hypothetical protein